jgi:hypothetical protein
MIPISMVASNTGSRRGARCLAGTAKPSTSIQVIGDQTSTAMAWVDTQPVEIGRGCCI